MASPNDAVSDRQRSTAAKSALLRLPTWAATDEFIVDQLNEADLAECVLTATIRGHERLVRDLIKRRGPVPIMVEHRGTGENDFWSGDQPVGYQYRYFTQDVKSRAGLKSLLAMITEFGMQGLIEPGPSFPLLWHRLDENQLLHKLPAMRFEGELPSLVAGALESPELAVVLHEESLSTGTSDAYKPLLCWASEDMIRQFPQGLAPLKVFQEVEGHGTLSQWKAKSGTLEGLEYGAIKVGVRPTNRCSELANFLFREMGPASARLGLNDKQGRVLCETTTDFILSFQGAECSEVNLLAASTFLQNYCPIEIMALQAAAACTRDFGLEKAQYHFRHHLTKSMSETFDLLFTALATDERVKDLMTKEQWSLLLQQADFTSAHSILALYQVLGLDNSGSSIALDDDDLLLLIDGGYRFADGTKVFNQDLDMRSHNRRVSLKEQPSVFISDHLSFTNQSVISQMSGSEIHAHVLSIYRGIHEMNLWPSQDIRPTDLTAALKMAARLDLTHSGHNKAMALHAYLVESGIQACVEAVSSPTQWVKLTEVFTADELQPYMKIMPSNAKGRLLELGMGM
jgi:hypothetical protein